MIKRVASIGGFVAVAIGVAVALNVFGPQENPDPNHTHADFAVWMPTGGDPEQASNRFVEKLDFSDQKYMSEAYDPNNGQELRVDPLRKYLHLHDGNGHIIHRHKPGLTLGEFFKSIGAEMTTSYFENGQELQNNCFMWEDIAGQKNTRCSGEFGYMIHMYVNGQEVSYNPDYVFNDGDKILIISASEDGEIGTALDEITNDACLYSRTCPWRGPAPTENCIADPSIPCVAP
jgi:hypothetical protein